MCTSRLNGASRLAGITALVVFVASAAARAQEPLRWKLAEGDNLHYHIAETMKLAASGGPQEDMTTTIRQEMDMAWTVESVNADGDAVIRQKFDDVKLTLIGTNGERIEYDSEGDDETASLAAMVAPIYDAMTAEAFTFTMTNRGEIKDVKVPEKVLEALKNSPSAAVLGDMASAEGLQRMIMKWALILPEKAPAKGDEWRARVKLTSPMGGEKIVESTYRYEGTKEIDGQTYSVFEPGLEMTFAGSNEAKTNVVEQDSSGEILFNPQTGRIHSAKIDRSVTMDVTASDESERQVIGQTIEVTEGDGRESRDESQEPEGAATN